MIMYQDHLEWWFLTFSLHYYSTLKITKRQVMTSNNIILHA